LHQFITIIHYMKNDFGNGQCTRYRSSVTNKSRKLTDRCPLLITHIRNGHKTTTVTTTSNLSREMAVFLAPQRTLVTGSKTKNSTLVTRFMKLRLWCLDEMRRIYSRASQHN
jgi:hypothetical protein